MALKGIHILLEPEQRKKLTEIARLEGRSISEVAREMIRCGILEKEQEYTCLRDKRLEALADAERVRKTILDERGGKAFEIDILKLIAEMRGGRENQHPIKCYLCDRSP